LYPDFITLRHHSTGKENLSVSLTLSKWTDYGKNRKKGKDEKKAASALIADEILSPT
jgi:hypothetical protein